MIVKRVAAGARTTRGIEVTDTWRGAALHALTAIGLPWPADRASGRRSSPVSMRQRLHTGARLGRTSHGAHSWWPSRSWPRL